MAATQDHADALAAVRKEVSTANAGKENAVPEPAQPASDLAKMFQEGTDAIATCRSADLFKQLESRSLTKEEQNIVTQRVALQRKMFQEYEKRERKRKVAEILSFCQDVTEEEALKALEFCNDREDEAAGQLASDPAFRRRCQAACGSQAPPARFKLAKCLSDGTVRSATESEIRRLCPNSAQDSGSGIATAVVASAPAETPTSGKPAAKVDGAATGTKLQPKVANAAVRVLVNMAINVEKAAALRSALQAALAAAGPSEAPMPAQAATTSDGALRAFAAEEAAAAPDTEMADAAADEAGPSGSNPGDAAAKPAGAAAQPKGGKAKGKSGAISRTGHTCRGRVKQKASKNAVLLEVGKLRAEKGWYNAGYIFPEGFKSRINFRSSVDIDQITIYECSVLGPGGQHWPQPTFQLVGMDRPDEVIIGKSCTACWTAAQKRINSEIEARRKAGEDLPPPPKTAIAGPEYFGFGQAEILEVIETLDPDHLCDVYWEGKEDRQAAMQGLPAPERAPRAERGASASGSGVKRTRAPKRRRGESDEEEEEAMNEDEDECQYMTNRWSAVSRTERYRKRCEADGDGGPVVDEKNPLPGLIDPITLEPVVTPAISPFGHVMGMATWKAVLAEHGKCPFTKQPLSWESCTVLSLSNIDRYRDRIK
ncbi:hypothetical protein WJX72_004551 [[Myrmecia] bisecta]|uniref:U-box domain-containing protein n=1 Tax=[Myrmecia] bisecta TaxID=41462 RepID=A0AAW1PGB1_9CHLO